jgi:L-iditol 2-dehydrogenase
VTSNRIAVFTGPGRVELRQEALPELVRGEVLVQIRACGLCTMEQRLWQGAEGHYPIAAGHETAGVVAAVHPEGVLGVAVGQGVAIALLDRCLQCAACRRGDTHLCTGKLVGRTPNILRRIGGLADYAIVPAWKLFPMPEQCSFDEIALCEPVACVVHSVHEAQLRFGDDVLVMGCGTMGFLHLLLARLRGARVAVSDPDPRRRRLALEHGASAAFAPTELAEGAARWATGGVDAAFLCVGNESAAAEAAAVVRAGGRVIYYASFPAAAGLGIDARRLHHEEVMLVGSRGQTLDDWQQATRLVAGGLIDLRPLISGRYPLENLADALQRASEPTTLRIIVHPQP